MARPLRIQYPGAVYHVTNRGNDRQVIFNDDHDRMQFLEILAKSVKTHGIALHGYVMMSNHFHILVETPLANLGKFMRHFNITYTSYFNRRYRRSGHLYQGRYKSFLVEKATYLSTCSRYLHLNPVKVGAVRKKSIKMRTEYLFQYKWSSLPGYVAIGKRDEFVTYGIVLEEYGGDGARGRRAYKERIVRDLSGYIELHENIIGQSLLGSEDFASWARENYLDANKDRERPSIGQIHRYVAREDILRVLAECLGCSPEEIPVSKGQVRQVAMDVLYRCGGLTNKEIGRLMGLDYSTVSLGRKRLDERRKQDRTLDAVLREIESKISKIKI